MDPKLKNILIKVIKVLSDDETSTLLNSLGLDESALSDLADVVKSDGRTAAHLEAMDVAQDNGDGTDKAVKDIVASSVDTAPELQKILHRDKPLYDDEENVALGSIAEAIKDRWQ